MKIFLDTANLDEIRKYSDRPILIRSHRHAGDTAELKKDKENLHDILKKHMTIPVINGLSPKSHPTQVLSDVFTIEEIKRKSISKLQICLIGDSNNVLNSLIEASVKFSFKLNIGCPKNNEPNKELLNWVPEIDINKGLCKTIKYMEKIDD